MAQKREVSPIEDNDMFDLDEAAKKKNTFLDKHPPISQEQRAEIVEDQKRAKSKYKYDIQAVESSLLEFFEKVTPITTKDGTVIATLRQLPYWEMVSLVPEVLLDKSLSEEEKSAIVKNDDEMQEMIYVMMERMIATPEHDAEWWKQRATPDFIIIFSDAIEKMFKGLENDVQFFPE